VRRLLPLIAIAAGCLARAPQAPAAREVKQAAAAPTRLQQMLETECSSCHDGSDQRLRLGEDVSLDLAQSRKVALWLSSKRMPPPPTAMSEQTRAALIHEACQIGGAAKMSACLEVFAPSMQSGLVREPFDVLRAIDRLAPTRTGLSPERAEEYRVVFARPTLVYRLDPTLSLMMLLTADERCQARSGGRAFDECVRSIMKLDLIKLEEPTR
jgi:hypothetical protein